MAPHALYIFKCKKNINLQADVIFGDRLGAAVMDFCIKIELVFAVLSILDERDGVVYPELARSDLFLSVTNVPIQFHVGKL